MREVEADGPLPPGPARWGFRQYVITGHPSPFGHRFEIRTPKDDLVALCRIKRGDEDIAFMGDEDGKDPLFTLKAKRVRLFARAYEVTDARTGKPFGEVRMREFQALRKSEWVMYDANGEQVGMVVESASPPTLLRQLVPVEALFRKTWQVHWGQQIAGHIRPSPTLLGDKAVVNLELDTKDAIDRRLALSVAVCINAELRFAQKSKPKT